MLSSDTSCARGAYSGFRTCTTFSPSTALPPPLLLLLLVLVLKPLPPSATMLPAAGPFWNSGLRRRISEPLPVLSTLLLPPLPCAAYVAALRGEEMLCGMLLGVGVGGTVLMLLPREDGLGLRPLEGALLFERGEPAAPPPPPPPPPAAVRNIRPSGGLLPPLRRCCGCSVMRSRSRSV